MAATTVDRETGEITPVEEARLGEERADFPDARLDPRFIQMRQGRPFVAYPGLLDLLHQLSEGYFAVETEVVQLPAADNGHTAVCVARVRIFDPQDADIVRRLTTGIGDACPENVSSQMRPHLIRMAETRAKARALRDAVNVGMAALEELGPDESEPRRSPPSTGREVTMSAEGPSQVPDFPGDRPAPVDRIMIEGKTWTRPQVEAGYRKVVEEAQAAGLALGQVDLVPVERTPLAVLAAKAQELRRRLGAKSTGK